VRFVPKSNPSKILIGEPVDPQLDVGLAIYQGKEVSVRPFSGTSVLDPGQKTESTETISRILSPLSQSEVGTIRCIGLNVSPLSAGHRGKSDQSRAELTIANSMSPTPPR
jgi:hypothetical protein